MDFQTSKVVFCSAVFGLALTATFTACGDENATEVVNSSGMTVVAKGDTLPECGSENAGNMIFVTDSSAVFYCADEKWSTLNGKDGKKGEKGNAGEVGQSGGVGTSCSAKAVNDGIEVSCGGEVVGTIKNGVAGGTTDGKNGKSCSATLDEKTKNVVITCETDDGKGVSYTIQNGTDGMDAYEIAKDNGFEGSVTDWLASLNGKDGKSCSATQNADKTVTTITCQDDEGKAVTYDVKNGEGCSAEDNEDGSYTIHCEGSDDVIINDGESAYELAKELASEKNESVGDVATWLEGLKGKQGDNCSAEEVLSDDEMKVIGIKIICGSEEKIVYNGTDAEPGEGCSFKDKGDGKIEMVCGDSDPITLYKAVCGAEGYDPAEKVCYDDELYNIEVCGEDKYNPAEQVCYNHELYSKKSSLYNETTGILRDFRDGQEYNAKTIEIAGANYKEVWMVENLNYNSNSIDKYGNKFINNRCGGGKKPEEGDCDVYGRLYTWAAAVGKSEKECGYGANLLCSLQGTIQGVCPGGWHLPSLDEWDAFLSAVGTLGSNGTLLKSTSGWVRDMQSDVSGDGTDQLGFNVLPAGKNGNSRGYYGDFWSSKENNHFRAIGIEFNIGSSVTRMDTQKSDELSVRCIKNKESSTSN